MNQRLARMDIAIFISALALLGLGVVLVYSSSFAVAQHRFGDADFFLERQVVRALIALACFIVFINVDYHVWGRISPYAFMAAVGMLVFVLLLPDSAAVNGAKRWIGLGPLNFQASDFARLVLVITIARRCEDLGPDIAVWKKVLPDLVKIGLVCGLILIEPNFSTAAIVGVIGLSLLFVGGARLQHIAGVMLMCLPVALTGLIGSSYRRARIISYFDLSKSAKDIGYQASQALIGLGNGGLFGVGLGEGKQKYFFLPEPHTDFAFAILGEELGFVGLMAVFLVFGVIIWRGLRTAAGAPDRMGQVMAFGFTLILGLYLLLHTAVNVGLVPTTGVPLPFLSYGGMSLVFTMIGTGILLNISSQAKHIAGGMARTQQERLHKYRP